MTLAALVLTVVKTAAVFALLGVTVRTLKRIDHRRAVSGGGPSRRGARRSPTLRPRPRRTRRSTLSSRGGLSDGAGAVGGDGGAGATGLADMARLAALAASRASALALLRRPRTSRRAPRALEIVERATLGRTSAVVLLRVRDQHVLLGVTDQQINVLRTLDPEPAIDLRLNHAGSAAGSSRRPRFRRRYRGGCQRHDVPERGAESWLERWSG